MDEQGYRFGVGVLVVASLVIAVILVLFFGAAPNFFAQRYLVTIRFDAAPGVATDTPVRKDGVQIGRVKDVKLLDVQGASLLNNNDEAGGVNLTLELDSQYTVLAGHQPKIGTGSLITGDAVVEFVKPTPENLLARFDGTGGSPRDGILDANELGVLNEPIKDGEYYKGGSVAPDPFDALLSMQESFGTTLTAIETAGNQVTALALDVRQMIGGGDGELKEIARQTKITIENFNQTLDAIEELFRDENLKQALGTMATRLPQLITEAEGVMQQTQDTLAAFEDVGRAAEATMQNVTEFTDPLGDQGEKIVSDAARAIENLDALLIDLKTVAGTVNQVAQRVNNGQGTLAKLVDDPELYFTVVRTLENFERLTLRLQPVIEDARIFSDKVARDPASIVKGALRRSSGGLK